MKKWVALACLFCTLTIAKPPQIIIGKIIKITDGDTVTLMARNYRKIRIRLASIDAPEKKQPFGQKSKQFLADLVFQKQVKAEIYGKDKYHRRIADIFIGDSWVNAEMVKSGMAFVYRRYNKSPYLIHLEKQARKQKKGVWQQPQHLIIYPWDFRH